jgi:hypothetical protein
MFVVLISYQFRIKIYYSKYPISMTKADLKRLKKKLPPRWRKAVHEKTGATYASIDKVSIGKFYNKEIIDAMIGQAQEYQDELKTRSEQIKAIV